MISKLKPFMAYLDHQQYGRLKSFSAKSKIPMSQLIREAVDARIAEGDRYVLGFNKGLQAAIDAIHNNRASQMKFPSGKSFGDVFKDDIEHLLIKEGNERKVTAEELVARLHEGSTSNEDQGDKSLGL